MRKIPATLKIAKGKEPAIVSGRLRVSKMLFIVNLRIYEEIVLETNKNI